MSKITIDDGGDNADTELQEIREELAEHIEESAETIDSALEENAETIEETLEEIKEDTKTWLEKTLAAALGPIAATLGPIAEAVSSLSETVTTNLLPRVEAMETQLIPPISETEILQDQMTEALNLSETEHPLKSGEENPVLQEVAETLDNPLQSIAKTIHKL